MISFNPVSRIRFKSRFVLYFTGFNLNVSIPFPGFVSNQVIEKYWVERKGEKFQSRFQDSFQIKLLPVPISPITISFNPVSRIRFKSSNMWCQFRTDKLCFNPVSRIRFKSSSIVSHLTNNCLVSIPFPGFVSNQVIGFFI